MKYIDVFPGSAKLVEGRMPSSSLLLIGPSGIGKTIFAKQFLYIGLINGENCIYVSTDESPERIEASMKGFGFNIEVYKRSNLFRILDCYSWKIGGASSSNYYVNNPADLAAVSKAIDNARQGLTNTRLVMDSITGFMSICSHNLTVFSKFLQFIVGKTRQTNSNAIFIATPEAHDLVFISYLREIFDGTLEMKMETSKDESSKEIRRLLRLFSLKGAKHKTQWTTFEIYDNGIKLGIENQPRCEMCSALIEWEPHEELIKGKKHFFDKPECASTYKKLKGIYGETFE